MKIKGIPIKYFFTPKYWMSYLRGKIIGKELQKGYMEQFMFRYTHPGCRECVKLGKCVHCGCDTYEKMLDPKSVCEGTYDNGEPFWGQMVSEKSWEDYKNLVGMEFKQQKVKVSDGSKQNN